MCQWPDLEKLCDAFAFRRPSEWQTVDPQPQFTIRGPSKSHGDSTPPRPPTPRPHCVGCPVAANMAATRGSRSGWARRHLHQNRGRLSNHDGGDRHGLHRRESRIAARGDARRYRLSLHPRHRGGAHPRCRSRAACSRPATRSSCAGTVSMRCRGCDRGSRRCASPSCAIPAIRAPTRPRTRRCGPTSASARC